MRWKKSTPGEGGERRVEQFTYTSTQPGLKGVWYGWCAHDPEWFWVHEHKRYDPGTKVCANWFTDGVVACRRCKPGAPRTQVAYVPVWREEDGCPCMVIVHEWAADKLAGVVYGRHVTVSCIETTGGVVVKLSGDERRWRSGNPQRQNPCDIAVSLLTMWAIPGLEDWCKGRGPRFGPTPTVETDEQGRHTLSVPPPTTKAEALAIHAHRNPPAVGASGVDGALNKALKRAKEAERNGKHGAEGGES